jgi:hydroxybutyrate-dimer hydrolase
VLNERYGELNADGRRRVRLDAGNTLVIASSVSNGGGAAIAAAELDRHGLIDGVAVAEPAIEMPANAGVAVQRGGSLVPVSGATWSTSPPRQPVPGLRALAPSAGHGAVWRRQLCGALQQSWRCRSPPTAARPLQKKGLLTGGTTAEQAERGAATPARLRLGG